LSGFVKLKTKMENQKKAIYPKGVAFFKPREGAPEWVKGSLIISVKDFFDWANENADLLIHNEKYGKQLKLTLTEKGVQVDTWKPAGQSANVAPATWGAESEGKDLPW